MVSCFLLQNNIQKMGGDTRDNTRCDQTQPLSRRRKHMEHCSESGKEHGFGTQAINRVPTQTVQERESRESAQNIHSTLQRYNWCRNVGREIFINLRVNHTLPLLNQYHDANKQIE